MAMIILLMLITFTGSAFPLQDDRKSCENMMLEPEVTITCYESLHFCDEIMEKMYDSIYDEDYHVDYTSIKYQCLVYDDEDQLIHSYDASYDSLYYSESESLSYNAKNINISATFFIYANISVFDHWTCVYTRKKYVVDEIIDEAGNEKCRRSLDEAAEMGKYYETYFSCDDNYKLLHCIDSKQRKYTDDIIWLQDCDIIYNSSVLQLARNDISTSLYSCATICDGTLVWIRHYKVCFTEAQNDDTLSIVSTSPVIQSQFGTNSTMTCVGYGGPIDSFRWENNVGETLCSVMIVYKDAPPTVNGRYSCFGSTNFPPLSVCSGSNICNYVKNFSTTLHITYLNESDIGSWSCVMKTSRGEHGSYMVLKDDTDILFLKDKLRHAWFYIIVLGVCVATCAFLFWLWKFFKLDLLLLFKNSFLVQSVKGDEKKFNVFLSYAAQSDDVEVKELLCKLTTWFYNKGYSVFDQHTSLAGGLRYNIAPEIAVDCHRMVVLLTPAYLKKEENLFTLQTGIKGSVDGLAKMIFITLPQFKDIKNKVFEEDETTLLAIDMAMKKKGNAVLVWKKEKRAHEFFKALDVAMPKFHQEAHHTAMLVRRANDVPVEKKLHLSNSKSFMILKTIKKHLLTS